MAPVTYSTKSKCLRRPSNHYWNQTDHNRSSFFKSLAEHQRPSLSISAISLVYSSCTYSSQMGPVILFHTIGASQMLPILLPLPPRLPSPHPHLKNSCHSPSTRSRVSFAAKLPSPIRAKFLLYRYTQNNPSDHFSHALSLSLHTYGALSGQKQGPVRSQVPST